MFWFSWLQIFHINSRRMLERKNRKYTLLAGPLIDYEMHLGLSPVLFCNCFQSLKNVKSIFKISLNKLSLRLYNEKFEWWLNDKQKSSTLKVGTEGRNCHANGIV